MAHQTMTDPANGNITVSSLSNIYMCFVCFKINRAEDHSVNCILPCNILVKYYYIYWINKQTKY